MLKDKIGTEFDSIKLIWRQLPRTERLVVGTLSRAADSFMFDYDGPDLERAKELGFDGYPGLPLERAPFNGQAMAALGARNLSTRREDYDRLATFWRIPQGADPFVSIGMTSGTLPTDLFEVAAEFKPIPNTEFITSLAGIQFCEGKDLLRESAPGVELHLERDPSNTFDANAVKVLWGGGHVAFIKKVHNQAVLRAWDAGLIVMATVEHAKVNGIVQEVLASIRFDTS